MDNVRKIYFYFYFSYTVQSTAFVIISWQASYPCAFTQLVLNITSNQPPQHPAPSPCTVHKSSVNTSLPWNCFLHCHMKCVVVNLNIYIIISSILKLCDIICVLWNTFNLTSLCSSLAACDTSLNTSLNAEYLCRCDSTALSFKHYIFCFINNLTQGRSLEEVTGPSGSKNVPHRFPLVVTRLHTLSITLLSQMNPIYTVL